jgi:hypothetical protein
MLWIEIEGRVLVMEFDPIVMPAQRDDSVVAEIPSEVTALTNAIEADGEVNVLAMLSAVISAIVRGLSSSSAESVS